MPLNIHELFKGVAIIIDDEVHNKEANIKKILDQLVSLNVPIVEYENIPPMEVVSHFQSLSFILFDWRLVKTEISQDEVMAGVSIPSELEEDNISRNIEFIKQLSQICFCPIFIFTNEEEGIIKEKLAAENVYIPEKPSNILIKSKQELQEDGLLIKVIEQWIKKNPSIYVLKEWEREYQKSKNRLFYEFQLISPVWPMVMWKCFNEDGVNQSLELGELISRNLHTRMKPFDFNKDLFTDNDITPERS